MSEGYGLNSLTDEVRGILIRLMTGVRVKDFHLMATPDIATPEIFTEIHQQQSDIALTPAESSLDWNIPAVVNEKSSAIAAEEKSVKPHIDAAVAQVETFACGEISVLVCDPMPDEYLSHAVENLNICHETGKQWNTGIDPAKMCIYSCSVMHGGTTCLNFRKERRFHRDIGRIFRIPKNIKPHSWRRLDIALIIRCWTLLKERAHAQWGEFPEDDLEMAAVYSDVDLSNVQKMKYNNTDRSLSVWFRTQASAGTLKSRRCVIIIGLIKGTGKVMQVMMPIDDDSFSL